ncbi:hypothetical protein BHU72_02480 [Desulfuribacillus stibiiarsenatis]|uniref:Aminodeoxychorismate synthase n=1 Tax=Desulfuribacillus stibiiarsenatis TaxID=1390249 RepID=A0A1E5L7B6_9FIRM|nr:hypothetical protein BHU72_02480 [Desulfuribacillus stibiiarsenatis]
MIDDKTYTQWKSEYTVIPVIKKLAFHGTVIDLCDAFPSEYQILLHSPRIGRYSFYAVRNVAFLTGTENGIQISNSEGQAPINIDGDPLLLLEDYFVKYQGPRVSVDMPFYGGLIGFFSYDIARYIENLPNTASDDLRLPLYYFSLVSDGIAVDHQNNEIYLFANALDDESYLDVCERIDEIESIIFSSSNPSHSDKDQYKDYAIQSNDEEKIIDACNTREYLEESFTEDGFCDAVDRIIDYIKAGDVFQVNLSLRRGLRTQNSPLQIYRALVEKNPSPYMSFIQTPEFVIASSSPELLVKVRGSMVETRPIAGTRSRGLNEEDESRLIDELMTNEKELAEHIMLVDLERNDLGRVCKYGTVEVDELFAIEKYSHVLHLVSNVRGELMDDKSLFDIVRAVFPGGTITGAPKVRTMEIIEELEPVKRGLYTGSIGWLGFQQDMELNIVIRTAIFKDGWAFVQAGAGIVYDSIPKREYKESMKKARALWEVLHSSGESI